MDPSAISTTIDPTAPPPEPPKQSRSSFSCDRHPAEQFTGFCPTCLCERLNTLENSSNAGDTPSSSRRPSSVTAALKNLFSVGGAAKPPKPSKRHPTCLSPKLRRTKSFSASKNEALSAVSFEPQRKSCDVRARSTRWSLFAPEKDDKNGASSSKKVLESSSKAVNSGVKIEANEHAFDEIEDDDEFKDAVCLQSTNDDDDVGAITSEIVEDVTDLKPMKDHIDLDVREKKYNNTSVVGGGFWAAASVFSKKLHKWRQKQKKMKQPNNGGVKMTKSPLEKSIPIRRRREAQLQIPDNSLGRRSCDTDPRFSLDTGRISLDDPRFSFEKPRASWDGHFVGKNFPRITEKVAPRFDNGRISFDDPRYSFEKPRASCDGKNFQRIAEKVAPRFDMQIPVEESSMKCIKEDDSVPGGLLQTRDYYLDSSSSSSRRKSLDRSSSVRKMAAEISSNSAASGVSPAKIDSLLFGERDAKDSNSNPMRDDCSEQSNGLRGGNKINAAISNGERRDQSKKPKSLGWRIWGFIYRRINGSKGSNEGDEKGSKGNGIQRSLSESWQGLRRDGLDNGFNRSNFRSNSSVSWRSGGSFLEKNRSARYSPNHFENNGLLRLYLAPMRGGQRGGGLGGIRANGSQSISRSVLRL